MGERNNDISRFLYDDRGGDRKERLAQAKDPNRGQILPFKKDENGKNRWALPQWAMDIYNTVSLPEDVRRGYTPTGQDAAGFATNVGMGGVSSSMIAGHTPDPNTLGMFLGKRAKGADTKALAHAMSLESKGADRNQIWKETGWFKDLDDQWKWEIPDDNFDINREGIQEAFDFRREGLSDIGENPDFAKWIGPEEPTDQAIHHPDLFSQYHDNPNAPPIDKPYLIPNQEAPAENWTTPTTQIGLKGDDGGSLYRGGYTGGPDQKIYAEGDTLDRVRWVVAHELQHAVQEREGHSLGSNMNKAAQWANDFAKALPEPAVKYIEARDKIARHEKMIKDLEQRINAKENGGNLEGWSLVDGDGFVDPNPTVEDLRSELNFSERMIKQTKGFLPELEEDIKPILPEVEKVIGIFNRQPWENYTRNAGEASARITQKRLDYTPLDRQMNHPLDDLDVPEDEVWTEDSFSKMLQKFKDFKSSVVEKEAEAGYEESLDSLINADEPRKYAEGGMVLDPVDELLREMGLL